ncbi:hypothetical protein NQU36_26275, partial [Escherichia coli]|uniref:hypothetical protein n=1 Tax=Escherichia coli TaxID=562 RepID=UPI002118C50B
MSLVADIFQVSLLHPDTPAIGPPGELPSESDTEAKNRSHVDQISQKSVADTEEGTWSNLELKLRQYVLAVTKASEDRLQAETS